MTYIVFATKEEAVKADQQVAANFNMGAGTTQYQGVTESDDGRWFFPKPPQVSLVFDPVANDKGGFTVTQETRDSMLGVTGFVVVDKINPKPAPAPEPTMTDTTTTTVTGV